MAESKRIFNAGKMNRDLDDRLVPSGEYRDALNVGIGRSEGSDVGAIENLKGNEIITGQDNISGTTIGHVRDQSGDTIYWFTTSATEDAIHEYGPDGVRTLVREPKAREADLPTCTPELQSRITEPPGSTGRRPQLPDLPDPPMGGCTNPAAANYDSAAAFDDGSCVICTAGMVVSDTCDGTTRVIVTQTGGLAADGTSCATSEQRIPDSAQCGFVPPPPPDPDPEYTSTQIMVTDCNINQDGSGASITLAHGTATITAPNPIPANTGTSPLTVTLTYTASGTIPNGFLNAGSAFSFPGLTHDCVQPGTDPPVPFVFTVSTTDSIADATSTGSATINGVDVGTAQSVNVVSGIAPDTGFEWVGGNPPAGLTVAVSYTGNEDGADLTLTQNGASATLSGTVDMAGTATITWSGATTQAVPQPFVFTVSTTDTIDNATSSGSSTINGAREGTAETVSVTSTITVDDGFEFVDATLLSPVLSGDTAGLTLNYTAGSGATTASVTGSVSAAGSATITWGGATTQAIVVPPTFSFFEAVIEEPVALGSLRSNNIENSHGFGPMSHDYTGDWTITFTVSGSGWIQDFPNDPDFWLQISDSPGATRLMSLSGSGPLTDTSMATGHYWECERNFGFNSRSGQLQLRAGDATGTILDTIDFTQDS